MTEVFDPALEEELNKARDYLRDIDDSIKNLTGRAPPESNSRFGGRGGGVGGRGGRRFVQDRFLSAGREGPVGMGGPLANRRRTFGQMRGEEENGRDWDYGAKRQRRSMGGMEPPMYQGDLYDDIEEPVFEPRPALASHVSLPVQDEQSRDEAITAIKGTEKKEQSVRNRRMFGVLMGTLSRFKKEEKTELHFKEQEKKQKEVEQKLESEKRERDEKLRREKSELFEQRKQKEEEITRLQRKKVMMQFAEREENHLKQLQKFIQTRRKPPIFYCPAKHTLRTIELQKKTERRLEETIQKKRKELQDKLENDPILNPAKVSQSSSALDNVDLKSTDRSANRRVTKKGPGRRNRKASENEKSDESDDDDGSSVASEKAEEKTPKKVAGDAAAAVKEDKAESGEIEGEPGKPDISGLEGKSEEKDKSGSESEESDDQDVDAVGDAKRELENLKKKSSGGGGKRKNDEKERAKHDENCEQEEDQEPMEED